MATEAFHLRACGTDCLCAARPVLEPATLPGHIPALPGPVVEVVHMEPPRRDPAKAAHEAAHCVAAHALGMAVRQVRIDVMPLASIQYEGAAPAACASVSMAGPHGERWSKRQMFRPFDADVRELIRAVKDARFGACDDCRVIMALVRELGAAAPDAEYLRRYREIEAATIEMIQTPRVWRAVSDLAEQLMIRGEITGDDAHDIMERHLPHGSLNF